MFKELKETMSKELKTSVRMRSHQIENISKVWKVRKETEKKPNRNSEVEKHNNGNLKIY